MPDLSEMLGDVYGEPEEPASSTPSSESSPEWADDEHLDRAFAEWTPGPGADAPAAERGMFAPSQPAPATHLAHDLAAALSEAVLAESSSDDEHDSHVEPIAVPAATPERVATNAFADLERPAVVEADIEAEAAIETETEAEPAPIPVPVHKAGWQRSDDDILPTGKAAKGGVRLPRPARAGKAPKAGKPDAGPKKQRRSFGDLMKMEIGGKKKK
jgi:hypothetical protein